VQDKKSTESWQSVSQQLAWLECCSSFLNLCKLENWKSSGGKLVLLTRTRQMPETKWKKKKNIKKKERRAISINAGNQMRPDHSDKRGQS